MEYENLKEYIMDIVKKEIIYREDKKYFEILEHDKNLKKFFRDFFSYDLLIEHEMIKLERITDQIGIAYGVSEFNKQEQYIIYLLILDFLEEVETGRTVLISDILSYVIDNYPIEVDWRNYYMNLSLIKVLRYCNEMKMLILLDGSEQEYLNNIGGEAEILYENTGISKHFMRYIPILTENLKEWRDYINLENSEEYNQKICFARRAIINNTIINSDEIAYDIIIENREVLEDEFDTYFNSRLIISEEFVYLLTDKNERSFSHAFPDSKNITTIGILLTNEISKKEKLEFSIEELMLILKKIVEENLALITNENKRKEPEDLIKDVLKLLEEINIVKTINNEKIIFSEFVYHINIGENGEVLEDE